MTPSAAHRDQSTHALFKKGEVVDLDFTNYNDFIRDPEKDVIVEFYDDRVFLFITLKIDFIESRLQHGSQYL